MAKLKPDQRWQKHLLERFHALKVSGELDKLRAEALGALGRRRLLTPKEYWKLPLSGGPLAYDSSWQKKLEKVAERFGLAPWTLKMACLLKGYDPEKDLFPMETRWPEVRIVTEHSDETFLRHLFYHSLRFGVHVYLNKGGCRTAIIFTDCCPAYGPLEYPLTDAQRPPKDKAFGVELVAPPGYPPEALQELARFAAQMSRELLRCLGYPFPKRLRASKLLGEADDLRLERSPLSKRELYEIVAEKWKEGSTSEDDERRKLTKSRRHKLRKRLIKPFQNHKAE